jgi:predicted nucleic acid-binding protein
MAPKAVYDAHSIISATLLPSGIPSSLLALDRAVQLHVSPVMLEEHTGVLHRLKFQFGEQVITDLLQKLPRQQFWCIRLGC